MRAEWATTRGWSGAGKRSGEDPVHPGEVIREDVIAPLGLAIAAAADRLEVRRAALSSVPNGPAALSAEMAVKIERAFSPRPEHLLAMQCTYDVAQAK